MMTYHHRRPATASRKTPVTAGQFPDRKPGRSLVDVESHAGESITGDLMTKAWGATDWGALAISVWGSKTIYLMPRSEEDKQVIDVLGLEYPALRSDLLHRSAARFNMVPVSLGVFALLVRAALMRGLSTRA